MPMQPGPQWFDTVQPARVWMTSSNGWHARTTRASSRHVASSQPESVMKMRWQSMSSRPLSRSSMYCT